VIRRRIAVRPVLGQMSRIHPSFHKFWLEHSCQVPRRRKAVRAELKALAFAALYGGRFEGS